ncbi:MAG: YcbK family protein [Akkermansiaceae bacterium]
MLQNVAAMDELTNKPTSSFSSAIVTPASGDPLLVGEMSASAPKHITRDLNTSRRKFMVTAGITTASIFIGSVESDAAFFGFGNKPVPGIPHAWVQAKGADVLRYARYVQSLNLRNITPRMVLAPHFKTRGRLSNSLPPKSYWQHMGPTLKVVDKMITRMGAPLKEVTSAYRSPRYNRAVGGKSRSYHMQNMAVDLKFNGVSPYHAAYVAKQLRSQGLYRGGIGRYSSFVHIDTRGSNVDWRG